MIVDTIAVAMLCCFPVLVIAAGLLDITTFTIPNWISLALVALYGPAAFVHHLAWPVVAISLAVGAVALLFGIFMFAMNWIGGGDAKLMAAAALWIGWPQTLQFLLFTGLAGGVLALTLIGMRSGWVRRYAVAGPGWIGRLAKPDGPAPYGVAIALGALIAFPHSALMGG